MKWVPSFLGAEPCLSKITYGRIGVKVWVYKGEVLKSAKTAQKKEGGNK